MIPVVIEQTKNGYERSYDIYSRLLKDRIIFIGQEINDYVSNIVIAQLLFLEAQNDKEDIYLYINSPTGVITSGLAIYDTMNFVKPDVVTIGIGQCASMAALLLSSGTKGKRYVLPNTRVMIHQPIGGAYGQAKDIEIHAEEILRIKRRVNEI